MASTDPTPENPAPILLRLTDVIARRKSAGNAERSYVASLYAKGLDKILDKIREESGEVCEAARETDESARKHLIHESADLMFHLLVLLGHRDIGWEEVEGELARRFGLGGLEEKAARGITRPDE